MYTIIIPVTKCIETSIHVYYEQPLNIPNAPFLIMDLLHHVTLLDGGSIITNMLHMIMDVMTNDYFAPLRVKIEHEVEAARVIRDEYNMVVLRNGLVIRDKA